MYGLNELLPTSENNIYIYFKYFKWVDLELVSLFLQVPRCIDSCISIDILVISSYRQFFPSVFQ